MRNSFLLMIFLILSSFACADTHPLAGVYSGKDNQENFSQHIVELTIHDDGSGFYQLFPIGVAQYARKIPFDSKDLVVSENFIKIEMPHENLPDFRVMLLLVKNGTFLRGTRTSLMRGNLRDTNFVTLIKQK